MEADILFPVRNSFYLGAYQAAIAEAADLDALTDAQKVERDVFVYRSYIELGSYDLVISEVSSASPQALQAIKLLAQYVGGKVDKGTVLDTAKRWIDDPATSCNATTLLVSGLIYASEEKFVEALKSCHSALSLEMLAVSVQVCLKLHRCDQAEKYLKAMVTMDEDATLTQLATAWVNLKLGGAKVQEAYFIYQELGERYNWTARLYISIAVCSMRMGDWEEAEKRLQEAYQKDAKNPETIANLICTGLHLGHNVSRYTNQLRAVAPEHTSVAVHTNAGELFERAASSVVAA